MLEPIKDSLRLMMPWMQIYDNTHYGKWLVGFWTEISTVKNFLHGSTFQSINVWQSMFMLAIRPLDRDDDEQRVKNEGSPEKYSQK